MMLFRRAFLKDLDDIYHIAKHCGIGMTTLPSDKKLLTERLKWSCDSFEKPLSHIQNEYYLFVLEDTSTRKIVGTSAIQAITGYDTPFYSYKLSKKTRVCRSLNIRNDYEILSLVNDHQGKSELCTLFLEPAFRHSHHGVLLSCARFLFMAHFPSRFASSVIAEMRGVSDDYGYSPFWEHIGVHFFKMTFREADQLTVSTDKQFIADLMPRNPIYIKLLDSYAQSVIGKPHPSTIPAMNMLIREGFRYTGYVDLFDAGPTLESPFHQIRAIEKSRVMTIKSLSDEIISKKCLIANTRLDFKAIIGQIICNEQQNTCIISKETAQLLSVTQGECIRLFRL